MIKLISALSILVLSVVALTACGGSDSVLQEYKQDSQAQEQPIIEQAQSDEPSAFLGQASSTVDSFTGDRITVIEGKSVSNASSSTIALACAGETPYVLMPTAVRSAGPIELSYITPSTVTAPNELQAHLIPVDIRADGSGQRLGIPWHWGRINSKGGRWRVPADHFAQAIMDDGEVQIRFLDSSVADLHVEFGKVEDSEHWQYLENCGQSLIFFGESVMDGEDADSVMIIIPPTSNIAEHSIVLRCIADPPSPLLPGPHLLWPGMSEEDYTIINRIAQDVIGPSISYSVSYTSFPPEMPVNEFEIYAFQTLFDWKIELIRHAHPWSWSRVHSERARDADKFVRTLLDEGHVFVTFQVEILPHGNEYETWEVSEQYLVGDLSAAEHWPLLEQCGK